MSILTASLQKGLVAAWNASTLNSKFTALGGSTPVLFDTEGEPGRGYPYCILREASPSIVGRMSSNADSGKRLVIEISQTLDVFAGIVTGDSRTAKQIAAYLAEEVMKVFGGHPSVARSAVISLDYGNHLNTQYTGDFGIPLSADEHQWRIDYNFLVDVPEA